MVFHNCMERHQVIPDRIEAGTYIASLCSRYWEGIQINNVLV